MAPIPEGHLFQNANTIVFITLDTLRFDAAAQALADGRLPNIASALTTPKWEERHSPASFTYAAHHAFFSGFLPTPLRTGSSPRLFAAAFAGSESTTVDTFVFDDATLPEALHAMGYRTICIGGTGFFNPNNQLGTVLPGLFSESYWEPGFGVTERSSPQNQVSFATQLLAQSGGPTFLFINISAIHQPNWFYLDDTPKQDTLESHAAALAAVDIALAPLFENLRARGKATGIICSDHGTAYGEGGYIGHRNGHPVVWHVPYGEFVIE